MKEGIYGLLTKIRKSGKAAVYVGALVIAAACLTVFSFRNDGPPVDRLPQTERGAVTAAVAGTVDEAPAPEAGSDSTTDEWYLILVNRWNTIPDEYEVELTELPDGQRIDSRIYPALQRMFHAARGDGVSPVVVSGYRTAEKQQDLMDSKIADYRAEGYAIEAAAAKAEAWVAPVGTSEHQLGIAVDIGGDGVRSKGAEVYDWLRENSYRYGFICRYPADKTEITGVINEPWHYRYVGVEAATEMWEQGLCLEEYLAARGEASPVPGVRASEER